KTAVHPNRRSRWWAGSLELVPTGGLPPRRARRKPQPSRPMTARQEQTAAPKDVRRSPPYPRPRSDFAGSFRCDSGKMLSPVVETVGALRQWRRAERNCTRTCRQSRCVQRRIRTREGFMLDGVMLLWFVLMAASLLFVAIDIRTTPESPVLKWGFVLLTAYTG